MFIAEIEHDLLWEPSSGQSSDGLCVVGQIARVAELFVAEIEHGLLWEPSSSQSSDGLCVVGMQGQTTGTEHNRADVLQLTTLPKRAHSK